MRDTLIGMIDEYLADVQAQEHLIYGVTKVVEHSQPVEPDGLVNVNVGEDAETTLQHPTIK